MGPDEFVHEVSPLVLNQDLRKYTVRPVGLGKGP